MLVQLKIKESIAKRHQEKRLLVITQRYFTVWQVQIVIVQTVKFWRAVIYSDFKVEEDAEIDMVRKRYHQLALLLHPDKSRHPKVETAFKLVSEAYACLSDKRKRTVYNVERSKLLCKKCQHMVQRTSSVSGEVQLGQSHPDLMWRTGITKEVQRPLIRMMKRMSLLIVKTRN